MYGFESTGDGLEQDDAQIECVVCYSAVKDTMVYPCRHNCLCSQCTQVVRMQSSKCPICRQQAEKFITIKIVNNWEEEVVS